jgi:hypothetical protein
MTEFFFCYILATYYLFKPFKKSQKKIHFLLVVAQWIQHALILLFDCGYYILQVFVFRNLKSSEYILGSIFNVILLPASIMANSL